MQHLLPDFTQAAGQSWSCIGYDGVHTTETVYGGPSPEPLGYTNQVMISEVLTNIPVLTRTSLRQPRVLTLHGKLFQRSHPCSTSHCPRRVQRYVWHVDMVLRSLFDGIADFIAHSQHMLVCAVEGCGKSYEHANTLNRHMRIKHGAGLIDRRA